MNTDYYTSLPKKYIGAGVLFTNEQAEILLLKLTYKDGYEVPGGVVDANEAPKQAALREVQEELNLVVPVGNLLVVDHWYVQNELDNIQMIFDGGVLKPQQIKQIQLQATEISASVFLTVRAIQAETDQMQSRLLNRVLLAFRARSEQICIYAENGIIIT